ncbi:MAG: Rrf2 family transcriptional regulator [Oscillospiraceae bacterium]|jgi:Rrf2 family protein
MLDLAKREAGEYTALKEIAEHQGISVKYLEQIITALCRAGYLKSQRGSQGGYRLTKTAAEYTVGDILRVTEGELAPVSCLEDINNQCSRFDRCATVNFWQGLYDSINNYVDSITLADLL